MTETTAESASLLRQRLGNTDRQSALGLRDGQLDGKGFVAVGA